MGELEFRDPWFLLATLAGPVVFLLASRRRSLLAYSSHEILDRGTPSIRSRLVKLPALLLALATVSLAIALAGPRTPDAETKISREGIAIMMVVDRSSSMDARDLVPDDVQINRLHVVKQVFNHFVLGNSGSGGRQDDAVGLIGFAAYADSLCPLTLDHGNLTSILETMEIVQRSDEDGTAIGDGLALAVERLRHSKATSRVVILLTDGVNNAGTINPDKAAEIAAAHHIKVYCIGAGTNGTAPIPMKGPFGTRLYAVEVNIDEDTLKEIADTTGGQYFRATDAEGLEEITQEIGQLERTKVTELRYLQYSELYAYFVTLALGLLGGALVLGATVLRTLP